MVLFKRKPLHLLPDPQIHDDDTEVWVVPWTQEVLLDYDAYLHRMDFLKQKRFICEITGHSGLSFFEAQRSETVGSQEVDSSFPDALREPVLRRIQFSTTSRIDSLVDQTFEDFKRDFYPGEPVIITLDDGARLQGVVREKADFPALRRGDGSVERKAFSRYSVRLMTRSGEEARVDDAHIMRDRKSFTKQMLRSFIKNTVTREAWTGAPWLVKPALAANYRIETEVPMHLRRDHKAAAKKAQLAAKREEYEGLHQFWATRELPHLKPAVKGPKAGPTAQMLANMREEQYQEYQRALLDQPTFVLPPNGYLNNETARSGHVNGIEDDANLPNLAAKPSRKSPSPPGIKYPIEDLELPVSKEMACRPALNLLSRSSYFKDFSTKSTHKNPRIPMKAVGDLLETWNTLNVYCQVFLLDSFTFDDFLEAMLFDSTDMECELLDEIHCAVLKQLVNAENHDDGAVQIFLPEVPPSDMEDEEQMDTKAAVHGRRPTPSPGPEAPSRRTTRSSMNKVEAEAASQRQGSAADVAKHRASELFGEYSWIARLRKRDFQNGGWQLVMAGLLNQLASRPRLQSACEEILAYLAPIHDQPTQETVRRQYATMPIVLRVQALQIICMLTMETKAIKGFLEESSAQMTDLRKSKIEHQRIRKEALAELKALYEERRHLQPEKSPTPPPELAKAIEAEVAEEENPSIADSEDEEPRTIRSLRRDNDRAAERKRKREEEEHRRAKAAEAKQSKGSRDFQRILKRLERVKEKIKREEDEIAVVDNDLREADCPRTRVLGKDRFWNRYYWFERNAMPYEGLPEASTADAGYANGRIWVQGPDDLERDGFIDVKTGDGKNGGRDVNRSRSRNRSSNVSLSMTPVERKKIEEGPTHVFNAREWAFYDKPEEVEDLISWLDVRGNREVRLRKELTEQQALISRHMKKRQEYLAKRKGEIEAGQEQESIRGWENKAEDQETKTIPATRTSTRLKTQTISQRHTSTRTDNNTTSQQPLRRQYPFVRWRNTMAARELGHKHMEATRPRSVKVGRGRPPLAGRRDDHSGVNEQRKGVAVLASVPKKMTKRSGRGRPRKEIRALQPEKRVVEESEKDSQESREGESEESKDESGDESEVDDARSEGEADEDEADDHSSAESTDDETVEEGENEDADANSGNEAADDEEEEDDEDEEEEEEEQMITRNRSTRKGPMK